MSMSLSNQQSLLSLIQTSTLFYYWAPICEFHKSFFVLAGCIVPLSSQRIRYKGAFLIQIPSFTASSSDNYQTFFVLNTPTSGVAGLTKEHITQHTRTGQSTPQSCRTSRRTTPTPRSSQTRSLSTTGLRLPALRRTSPPRVRRTGARCPSASLSRLALVRTSQVLTLPSLQHQHASLLAVAARCLLQAVVVPSLQRQLTVVVL